MNTFIILLVIGLFLIAGGLIGYNANPSNKLFIGLAFCGVALIVGSFFHPDFKKLLDKKTNETDTDETDTDETDTDEIENSTGMKRPLRTGQENGLMEMAPSATKEPYRMREYFTADDFESTVVSATLTNEDVLLEQVFIIPEDNPDTRIFFYKKDTPTSEPKIVENVNYSWNDEDSLGIDVSLEKTKCESNQTFNCNSNESVEKDGKTYLNVIQNQEMTLNKLGDPIDIDYDGTEVYIFSLFLDTEKQDKFNIKFKYNMSDKVQLLSNLVPEISESYAGSNIFNISYISPESVTSPLFDGTITSNVEVASNYIDGNINVEFEEEDDEDITLNFKDMTKIIEGVEKHYVITDNGIKYKFVIKKDDPPAESI